MNFVFFLCQRYKPGEEIVFSYGDKDKGSLRSHSFKFFFFRSDWQDSDALLLQHGFVEEEPLLVANLQ